MTKYGKRQTIDKKDKQRYFTGFSTYHMLIKKMVTDDTVVILGDSLFMTSEYRQFPERQEYAS